ncbi:MAG: ADP/ATP carrier protein [Rickettsia sp.]|nr:ADP/ATP carrier protein [Rickettsia sp.]
MQIFFIMLNIIQFFNKFVNKEKLIKFFSLSMLMFLILLNQNIIRNVSTSIIVIKLGTESISFIKLWIQLPLGLGFMLLNIKLMNIITSEQIFRVITSIFLVFFFCFAFILFPNVEFFHPQESIVNNLVSNFPYLKWFFLLWGSWCYVLFFTITDFWPVVIVLLFYWQLANKINSVKEATKIYVPIGIVSQSNMIFASAILSYFASGDHFLLPFFEKIYDQTEIFLKSTTVIVCITGVFILIFHRYIEIHNIDSLTKFKVKNKRIDVLSYGIIKSLKLIFTSKYLILAFLVTVSYSICVHMIEGLWFSRAKALYSSTEEFSQYQSNVLLITSIVALFFTLIGSLMLKYFGWFFTIAITPVMFCIFGSIFFILTIFVNRFYNLVDLLNISKDFLLQITILFASLQNIFGKGAKYSLYDSTKEMVYIPLDDEMKNKGKIAVTLLGAQIGKAFGSLIQFLSFTFYPNAQHEDIAEFLFFWFFVTCIIWIWFLKLLNNLYHEKLH